MKRRDFIRICGAALAGSLLPIYRVRAGDATLPPLRILFFTDLHAMLERDAPQKMQATAQLIAETPCDLIIGGGDFIHGGFASKPDDISPRFEAAKAFLGNLGRPVRMVLGNHDLVDAATSTPREARRFFRELSGQDETNYTFDQGGHRFFVLDSVKVVDAPERYHGNVDDGQVAWLKQQLEQTPPEMPLILCSHIPFRTTFLQVKTGPATPLPPNLVVSNANEILEMFSKHRLVLVLQGHLHVNEQIVWNGLDFVMGGAVSGAWWAGDNLGTRPGFGLIELGSGSTAWDYTASGMG
jgi:predicted MPP superfamily phosphohydrolase